MEKQSNSQTDIVYIPKSTSELKEYINKYKIELFVSFGMLILLCSLCSSMMPSPKSTIGKSEISIVTPSLTYVENSTTPTVSKVLLNFNVVVTSQIVKEVDGKCRYFFDIRNNDEKVFSGKVVISLIKPNGNTWWSDTFDTVTPLSKGLGRSVYITISTCPVSIHGDFGISDFKYIVKVDDVVVKEGKESITDKFE